MELLLISFIILFAFTLNDNLLDCVNYLLRHLVFSGIAFPRCPDGFHFDRLTFLLRFPTRRIDARILSNQTRKSNRGFHFLLYVKSSGFCVSRGCSKNGGNITVRLVVVEQLEMARQDQ